ncbi:MAG: hypothetical protein RI945_45, partial [Candidatus Parcubacteria bacterium]
MSQEKIYSNEDSGFNKKTTEQTMTLERLDTLSNKFDINPKEEALDENSEKYLDVKSKIETGGRDEINNKEDKEFVLKVYKNELEKLKLGKSEVVDNYTRYYASRLKRVDGMLSSENADMVYLSDLKKGLELDFNSFKNRLDKSEIEQVDSLFKSIYSSLTIQDVD